MVSRMLYFLLLKAMLIHDRVGYILTGKNQQEHREFCASYIILFPDEHPAGVKN